MVALGITIIAVVKLQGRVGVSRCLWGPFLLRLAGLDLCHFWVGLSPRDERSGDRRHGTHCRGIWTAGDAVTVRNNRDDVTTF